MSEFREALIDRLCSLEVSIPVAGPAAGVILADTFADALIPVFVDELRRFARHLDAHAAELQFLCPPEKRDDAGVEGVRQAARWVRYHATVIEAREDQRADPH